MIKQPLRCLQKFQGKHYIVLNQHSEYRWPHFFNLLGLILLGHCFVSEKRVRGHSIMQRNNA